MYQHILAPLKRDDSDKTVVEHGGELARLTGGRLSLLHVVHSHSRDESVFLEEQARGYLGGWVERLAASGIPADAHVVVGEAAEGITTLARGLGVDLVVMATHGHSEVRHVLMGSVTEDVVRNGDRPVLLVRPLPD